MSVILKKKRRFSEKHRNAERRKKAFYHKQADSVKGTYYIPKANSRDKKYVNRKVRKAPINEESVCCKGNLHKLSLFTGRKYFKSL